jgi:hypothetical protein
VPKWVKLCVAILLLPVCAGALGALGLVLKASGRADTIWVPGLAGAGCWLAIFVLLPKPMWIYVAGHEFTHALWTWGMGGRVKKFRISSKGGHVIVTKTNFLITLAPYFFPLYAVLVVVLFVTGDMIWGWSRLAPWFHLLLGAAYAFHVTLTLHALKHSQTDITSQGWLFSGAVIFLGNVTVLLIGIPLITGQVGIPAAFAWWLQCTGEILSRGLTLLPTRG